MRACLQYIWFPSHVQVLADLHTLQYGCVLRLYNEVIMTHNSDCRLQVLTGFNTAERYTLLSRL